MAAMEKDLNQRMARAFEALVEMDIEEKALVEVGTHRGEAIVVLFCGELEIVLLDTQSTPVSEY